MTFYYFPHVVDDKAGTERFSNLPKINSHSVVAISVYNGPSILSSWLK